MQVYEVDGLAIQLVGLERRFLIMSGRPFLLKRKLWIQEAKETEKNKI